MKVEPYRVFQNETINRYRYITSVETRYNNRVNMNTKMFYKNVRAKIRKKHHFIAEIVIARKFEGRSFSNENQYSTVADRTMELLSSSEKLHSNEMNTLQNPKFKESVALTLLF